MSNNQITQKPAYLATQARFKCQCKRPFPNRDKKTCGKCRKKLRDN